LTEAEFCPFCGTKVGTGHSFCLKCGKPLPIGAPQKALPAPPVEPESALPAQYIPELSRLPAPEELRSSCTARKWRAVWVSLLGVTVVLIGVAFFLPAQSNGLANPDQAPLLIAALLCVVGVVVAVLLSSLAFRLSFVKLPPELEIRRKGAARKGEWWFIAGIVLFFLGAAGQQSASAAHSSSAIGVVALVGFAMIVYGIVLDHEAGKFERKLKLEWLASQREKPGG